MTATVPAGPSYLPWRSAGFWAWMVTTFLFTMAALAPVRPWGHTGRLALVLGVVTALIAWRATPGVLPARAWPAALAGGALLAVVVDALNRSAP